MMKMFVNITLFSAILAISSVSFGAEPFKIKGQPVHPGCLSIFNRFSKTIDYVTEINLDQCQLRQKERADNKVSRTTPGQWLKVNYSPEFGGGFYQYHLIGKTLNGIYVIDTINNTGGAGEYEGILLIRVSTNKEQHWNPVLKHFEPVWHTTLELVSRIEGGDRADGSFYSLKVFGNNVKGLKYSDENDPNSKPQHPDERIDVDLSGL